MAKDKKSLLKILDILASLCFPVIEFVLYQSVTFYSLTFYTYFTFQGLFFIKIVKRLFKF